MGQVRVHVTNRGGTAWSADAGDSGYMHGWVVPEGEDRTATLGRAWAWYTMTAALVELDLWAAPRTITLG